MATWHDTDSETLDVALHDWSSNAKIHAEGNDYNRGSSTPQRPPPSTTPSDTPHRRKKRRRCICAVVAAVALLVILACAIAVPLALRGKTDNGGSRRSNNSTSQALIKACKATLYPTVCVDSLSNLTNGVGNSPQQMVELSLSVATQRVTQELTTAQALFVNTSTVGSPKLRGALRDCIEFLQDSLDSLGQTLDGLKSLDVANLQDDLADLETWMTASLSNQGTCLDELDYLNSSTVDGSLADFEQQGRYNTMLLSNVLAFVTALQNVAGDLPGIPGDIPKIPGHRRLLATNEATTTFLERRLLKSSASSPTANFVVAQDGSGNYRRIQDAVNNAPVRLTNKTQFVIYIKAGKYVETVQVRKHIDNVVFLGDGVGKTIISGSLSVIGSNVTTSATATLTIRGLNFVGRDFTVENTAGAANHQAVAMRVTGDFAAFENCQFLGYQDTLYTHTHRQFYKNCTIVGTVDFIFGNAAVVFQNSQILATTGIIGQQNTYTASGRTDPNQNSGISFQSCTFDGTASLKNASAAFRTYLGRPWKNYARTVVMKSVESDLLDPTGWLTWNGVAPNSTVYYGEYQNTGPGSNQTVRVPWSSQISRSQANKFTVNSFITGKKWLPDVNITYIGSV